MWLLWKEGGVVVVGVVVGWVGGGGGCVGGLLPVCCAVRCDSSQLGVLLQLTWKLPE